MKRVLGLLGTMMLAGVLQAQTPTSEPTQDVFTQRVDKVLKTMNLPPEKQQAALQVMIDNHKKINDLQDAYTAAKADAGKDKEKLDAAKKAQDDGRTAAHKDMVDGLAAQLTPEQVDQVKDAVTVNKVKITYDVYCQELPQMTDEQKAHVLDLLKQAREKSLDCGSMKERDVVFKDFKGKCNIYLSKQGLDQKAGEKQLFNKNKKSGTTTQAS